MSKITSEENKVFKSMSIKKYLKTMFFGYKPKKFELNSSAVSAKQLPNAIPLFLPHGSCKQRLLPKRL
jgi:hypothetical protein